ncbi:hypothetical protein BDW22DRAFT_1350191 [Trametopsis cervina]|nr:hypothetical protein BDW22DRAFT_1350191 [Trametopsis cervina]
MAAEADTVRIRPYTREDDKLVRFTIGRACVDGLATANKTLYFHPIVISAWFALSCALLQYLQVWPEAGGPLWTWLKPLPIFAAIAVPLMSIIDWKNRPDFERRAENVLRRADLYQIEPYYSRSPSSGVWILEFGPKFVGLVCVDASQDSLSEETLKDADKDDKKYLQNKWRKGTSNTAVIRHYYVMEQYRETGITDDLLEYVIKQTFNNDKTVKSIRATESRLEKWTTKALQQQGFTIEKTVGKLGLLGWELRSRVLTRKVWEERQRTAVEETPKTK